MNNQHAFEIWFTSQAYPQEHCIELYANDIEAAKTEALRRLKADYGDGFEEMAFYMAYARPMTAEQIAKSLAESGK